MRGLRYLLIVASPGTAAFLTYFFLTKQVNSPWIVAGFIAACVLNVIYLALVGPPNSKQERLPTLPCHRALVRFFDGHRLGKRGCAIVLGFNGALKISQACVILLHLA
jgi:hypothetical protein